MLQVVLLLAGALHVHTYSYAYAKYMQPNNDISLTNTANLHASTSQGTQGALSTWAWGLGLVASSSTQLDVQCCDAQLLYIQKRWRDDFETPVFT